MVAEVGKVVTIGGDDKKYNKILIGSFARGIVYKFQLLVINN